ncbi:MAG: 3-deoxy-D-manno-octulosonic acid transferase [Pseudomonadota bacterium]
MPMTLSMVDTPSLNPGLDSGLGRHQRTPLLWATYEVAARAATPFLPLFLKRRLARGKEDPTRLNEKLGHASRERPDGDLIWMHGASIGETLALLPLVARLRSETGASILLTSGTVTSAFILANRLQEGTFHQFAPLDAPAAIERFLNHWRPRMVVFAESEIWPNTIRAVKERRIPMALVNARLSERSARRWQRFGEASSALFGQFDTVVAQSDQDTMRLTRVGARNAKAAGNLKYDAARSGEMLPPSDAEYEAAKDRKILLGMSTHPGEEAAIFQAYQSLKDEFPGLLCVSVPRHPERGLMVKEEAEKLGLNVSTRSKGEQLTQESDVWLFDTVGEMPIALALADIAILGKSFNGGGAQNPIEAAFAKVPLIHGPSTHYFDDVIGQLKAANGVITIGGPNEIADACATLLRDPEAAETLAVNAWKAAMALTGATERTLAELMPLYHGADA